MLSNTAVCSSKVWAAPEHANGQRPRSGLLQAAHSCQAPLTATGSSVGGILSSALVAGLDAALQVLGGMQQLPNKLIGNTPFNTAATIISNTAVLP